MVRLIMIEKMLRYISIVLLLLFSSNYVSGSCEPVDNAATGDNAMPDLFYIFLDDFTMEMEMTQAYYNHTSYVTHSYYANNNEEFPEEEHAVRVDTNGSYIVYHYFPEEMNYVEQFDDSCYENDDTTHFYKPFGWYDDDGIHGLPMYGPATIFRTAHFENAAYDGDDDYFINNAVCQRWHVCIDGQTRIDFYFSARGGFTMPENGMFQDNRLPVMFEVFDGDKGHILYNIIKFVPDITHESSIETPRGLACEGLISINPYAQHPKIPNSFSFAQEIIRNPFIEGIMFEKDQDIDKYKLTYSKKLSMVRLEITPNEFQQYDKIIHDFNTGVEYAINRQYGSCNRDFIPENSFDKHGDGREGGLSVMAGPNQLFHLDKSYSFVGYRGERSIFSDLYTSTRSDIPDTKEGYRKYPKAVLEYYFSEGKEITPNSIEIPLRGDLFIYNETDPLAVQQTETTNIYDQREVTGHSTDEFNVNECYDENSDDWSTLYLFFKANKIQFAAEAADEHGFEQQVFSRLLTVGDISPTRIGKISVSDGSSGWYSNTSDSDTIIVLVKLMERAPYLFGYTMPDDPFEVPGSSEPGHQSDGPEDCAQMCTLEDDFKCLSFHFCENQGMCYLSNSESAWGPQTLNYSCDHYVDNHENQTFDDLPTSDVDTRLQKFIKQGKFTVQLPYKNINVTFTALDHLMFKTPDPTDPIRGQFFRYDSGHTISDADAEVDLTDDTSSVACMTACLERIDFRCETIVYNTKTGTCLLYTEYISSINSSRFEVSGNSYIFSRLYLDEYKPMLGGISINTTGPIVASFSPEDCAQVCSTSQDFDCNSFEYCWKDHTCHLHVETFIDVSDKGNYSQHQPCIHFEKKAEQIFTRYPNQGMTNKYHKIAAQLTTVSECAKMCLQDKTPTCQSFDFCESCQASDSDVCGSDLKGGTNMCFLGNHHIGEPGLKLLVSEDCEHYSRDLFGDQDYAAWIASQRKSKYPYTGGSMTGLAFGMIILGIALVVILLGVLTYYSPGVLPQSLIVNGTRLTSGVSTVRFSFKGSSRKVVEPSMNYGNLSAASGESYI